MQRFLQQHPWAFTGLMTIAFAVTLYVGSIFSLPLNRTTLTALTLAGAVLGFILACEILMIQTARKLKIQQLLGAAMGSAGVALLIQMSLSAALAGAGIGLLLAVTANKRIYSIKDEARH